MVKTAKKKISKRGSNKKVVDVLHGSTKFKMEISLIVLRFDPKFIIKFLQEIAEDVDKGKVTQISQSTNSIVLLCDEILARKIEKKYKNYVLKHEKDLVAFTIMFPKRAIETPGVISFISDMFSKNKITIVEIVGCYTDITFVIHRKDLFKAMNLLGEFIL